MSQLSGLHHEQLLGKFFKQMREQASLYRAMARPHPGHIDHGNGHSTTIASLHKRILTMHAGNPVDSCALPLAEELVETEVEDIYQRWCDWLNCVFGSSDWSYGLTMRSLVSLMTDSFESWLPRPFLGSQLATCAASQPLQHSLWGSKGLCIAAFARPITTH